MSTASLFLIMTLMFVGASPGGTGGGMKTTSLATLMAAMWAIVRGKKSASLFGRRLPEATQLRAFTVSLIYAAIVAFFVMAMLAIKSFGLESIMFETISAVGTVGLSTGITPHLSTSEKIIIIFAMFLGRIGPLGLGIALLEKKKTETIRLPEGKILVG